MMTPDDNRTVFSAAVRLFLDACPGPPMLRAGLARAAFQTIEGIPGLGESQPDVGTQRSEPTSNTARMGTRSSSRNGRGEVGYLRSVVGVANRLNARPGYLSETAKRHGFSYAKALRWIRYLHGVSLLAHGQRVDEVAWSLGFCDAAGWSRFTKRLLGKSPSQLPALPLEWWVRKAVDDVFLGMPVTGVAPLPNEKQ